MSAKGLSSMVAVNVIIVVWEGRAARCPCTRAFTFLPLQGPASDQVSCHSAKVHCYCRGLNSVSPKFV